MHCKKYFTLSQVYPAYTAAGARIHVASDVAHTVRSHSAPRLPPKEAVVTPQPTPASAAGTPAKKKLSTGGGGGGGGGHRVSQDMLMNMLRRESSVDCCVWTLQSCHTI